MAHKHSVYDTDLHFKIDPITRAILNMATTKTKIIQGDHNSERFTFEIPRLVDGHDMMLCDKIEVHYINVASDGKNKSEDVYFVEDMQTSPEDENIVIFSWLISGNATVYPGSLNFLIRFVCLTGEAIDYAWHTEIFNKMTISNGMNNGESVVEEYSDVLEAWKREIGLDTLQDKTNALDKRVTNIENTLNDDLFVTGDMGYVKSQTVPENALPYAEVKKIYALGGYDLNGILRPRRIMRVESCKSAEKENLNLTLDLLGMSPDMTVEKLSDGSFKFNGYTNFQGNGYGACKFATVTLPKGQYGINYNVISGEGSPIITANGNTINSYVDMSGCLSIPEDNTTLNFYIEHEGTNGSLMDLILSFEICEGTIDHYEFVPALVPFATLEIPEEIYDIDWGGELGCNYLDLEERVAVVFRRFINGASVALDEPEEIDISDYLGVDNFIEVVPNGIIRVVQDTGEIMTCQREIVFMVKGVE